MDGVDSFFAAHGETPVMYQDSIMVLGNDFLTSGIRDSTPSRGPDPQHPEGSDLRYPSSSSARSHSDVRSATFL